MSTQRIAFFVPGLPATAGSKKAFYNKKTGRAIITADCKRVRPWMNDVKHFAFEAYQGPLIRGGVVLTILFTLPRPAGHFGTGRNAGSVKPSAPVKPIKRPDLTKMVRAVEDALKGVVWKDDSQVVEQHTKKAYGDRPGANILVEAMDGPGSAKERDAGEPDVPREKEKA